MTRLGPLDPETMDEALRKEYDSLVRNRGVPPEGIFGGPFDGWLRSPVLCHEMRVFGGLLWEQTSLDRGVVELAIAIAAAYWHSNVDWSHAARAVELGIDQAVLDAVEAGRRPASDRADVLVTYDLAQAFLQNKSLSEQLYQQAVSVIGERGIVEVAFLVGYYTTIAYTTRAFDVEPPADRARTFSRPPEV